jgi:2-oxoglutarate/2-oxoacid ferredoxin oxidoreductase subunit alpha
MLFARRGLHVNAYNAHQSIIRGGQTFLTIRTGVENVRCFGDQIWRPARPSFTTAT